MKEIEKIQREKENDRASEREINRVRDREKER